MFIYISSCQNPPQDIDKIKAGLFVINKKENIDGINFQLSKVSHHYEFTVVWDNVSDEIKQSEYLINSTERGIETIKWGQTVNSFRCADAESIVLKVQRSNNNKALESQEYQLHCPIDIQAGKTEDELKLISLLSHPQRKEVFLGEVFLNSIKDLVIPVNQTDKVSILKVIAPDSGAGIVIVPGVELSNAYKNQSLLAGLYQTYRKRETHPAFHEQMSENQELKSLLKQKSDANSLKLPRLKIEIGEFQGNVRIHSLGLDGVPGKSSESAFSVRYRLTNSVAVTPPGPAENDSFNYILDVNSNRPRQVINCLKLGSSGLKGNPGTIQGAPGVDGGPGLAPIGLDINILKSSGKSNLILSQHPSAGGAPSHPGVGQKGSVGGLGGQKFCDRSNSRYPSGPVGDNASLGELGEVGQKSGCSVMNVYGSSGVSVSSRFEQCPIVAGVNYLNIKSEELSRKELIFMTPMKIIEERVSTLGIINDSNRRHHIERVIE